MVMAKVMAKVRHDYTRVGMYVGTDSSQQLFL